MSAAIPWDALKDVGLGGIVTAVIYMILTGRLVPRFFYQQKVEEANSWKAAAQEGQKQTAELLEYARSADAILKALPRVGAHSEVD